jgi:hypothetical protein
MKIFINDKELFEFSEIQKKVMGYEINEDELEENIGNLIQYVLSQKYEACFTRLKNEWLPKLIDNEVRNIPLDKDEFTQLIFSQSNYKSYKEQKNEADLTVRKRIRNE